MSLAFRIIYTVVWTLLLPILALMSLTFVKKWRESLWQKLGFSKQSFKPHPIWFHAVSVGELNALLPLLRYFEGFNLVLSTSTSSAQKMARAKLAAEIEANKIQLIYMPYDHPMIISSILNRMGPSLLVLMETEIWPALISACETRKIPVAVINARLADKSFKNYKMLFDFFKTIFAKISLVLAQSPADSRKFLELGVEQKKLFMSGNIKFASYPALDKKQAQNLKQELGYNEEDFIFVAASTHPSEEASLLSIFHELKDDYPQLKIIVAPRHPERFDTVEDFIQSAAKLETIRFSKLKNNTESKALNQDDVLLVDTIGDLTKILSIASLAFVGGTIVDNVGGHNVLEPASYGVPVIVGPYVFKNTETVEMMQNAGALTLCDSLQDIKFAIKHILENENDRVLMGSKAIELINQNKQIVSTTAEKLKELLAKRKVGTYNYV